VRQPLYLRVLDYGLRIEAEDESLLGLVRTVYGHLQSTPRQDAIGYRLDSDAGRLAIWRDGERLATVSDVGELLWELDGHLAVALQGARSDLYFLHAAVLSYADRAFAFAARAGGGKSSLTWALLHRAEVSYLSDELCPVELAGGPRAHPFPRALSLKSPPAAPFGLPASAVSTPRAIYLPTDALPARTVDRPLPLDAIFSLEYDPTTSDPVVTPLRTAEAAARIYTTALNPLAHPGSGLDGAIEIASRCRCFRLISSDLEATCRAVMATILDSTPRARGGASNDPPRAGD
jgi:hypothetical protein